MKPLALQDICFDTVKEKVYVYAQLVAGCALPVAERLCVLLPPSDLLELETEIQAQLDTEPAWKEQCKKRRITRIQGSSQCSCDGIFSHIFEASEKNKTYFKDLWLKWYFSSYLLPHFQYRRDEYRARAVYPDGHVFFARSGEREEEFRSWTVEELCGHTLTLAKHVKEIAVHAGTLHNLQTVYPDIISAFRARLESLSILFLEDSRFHSCLKVVVQLMFQGRLNRLSLQDVQLNHIHWDLLFFVSSGRLHCSDCLVQWDQYMEVVDTLLFSSFLKTFKELRNLAVTLTDTDCTPSTSCAQTSASSHAHSHIGPKTFSEDQPGSPTGPQTFSEDQPDSPTGPQTLSGAQAYSLTGPQTLRGAQVYSPTGPNILSGEQANGEAGCERLKRNPGEWVRGNPGEWVRGNPGEWVEETVDGSVVDSADSTSPHTEKQSETELWDEALGVSVTTDTAGGFDWAEEERNTNYSHAFYRLGEVMCQGYRDKHRCGIRSLVLSPLLRINNDRLPQALATRLPQALATSLLNWNSLSSLHLYLPADAKMSLVTRELAAKLGQGGLRDVQVTLIETDSVWRQTTECDLLVWDLLNALSSCYRGGDKAPQPMKQVRISGSTGVKIGTVNNSLNLPEEGNIYGVQLLELRHVWFDNIEAFLPLTQYIRRDQALCHLSLKGAKLKMGWVDLLLDALSGKRHSLRSLNLHSSIEYHWDSWWSKLCHLLTQCQFLQFLSLERCTLQSHQVSDEKFTTAVRMHGNNRKLTLLLSHNPNIGDGLPCFLLNTLRPESSLYNLAIVGTFQEKHQALDAANRVVEKDVSHKLQHLLYGERLYSHAQTRSLVNEQLQKKMSQIARVATEVTRRDIGAEHMALM